MGKYWEDMENYMIIYNGIHRSTYIYIYIPYGIYLTLREVRVKVY